MTNSPQTSTLQDAPDFVISFSGFTARLSAKAASVERQAATEKDQARSNSGMQESGKAISVPDLLKKTSNSLLESG
jgi:hypothetical protein